VRRSELVHVVWLAGGLFMLEEAAVPRSLADLEFPSLDRLNDFLSLF
jgi:hypothetical protein